MNAIFWVCGIATLAISACVAAAAPSRFDTPEAAVAALVAAHEAGDRVAVLRAFGPENEDVVSTGDAEEDREIWGAFLRDVQAIGHVELEKDDRARLRAGPNMWPILAPLLRSGGAARDEVPARRIGRNELKFIDLLRRAGDVQSTYLRTDHDGDGVMEFAAAILSSPGARDGLYWQDESGGEPSSPDETIARESSGNFGFDETDHDPGPCEGSLFRILQRQEDAAPAGTYGYLIAGNMVTGDALLAYPAVYGDTGIMSFLVGEAGVVHEADLGEDTLLQAQEIELVDPGQDRTPVD